jgi:antitoxin HigA-1
MPRSTRYRMPPHPGRILKEDLLDPLGMSINQLARALRVPANRLSQIVQGRRSVTPDTSLRLARYFGFNPDYWLNLQSHFDLEVARRQSAPRIESEVIPREAA